MLTPFSSLPSPDPRRPRRPRRAFTLIEIMVVVAIIVILAGIGIVIGAQVKRKSAENLTRTTLETVRQLMNTYLQDHPEPNNSTWLGAFMGDPKVARGIATFKGLPKELDDGFGGPIQYVPSAGRGGYFRSFGPNGVDDTNTPAPGGDDILSNPVGP